MSVCSLRKDELTIYNKNDASLGQESSYIDSLGRQSVVLDQAISYDGVRGISRYLIEALGNNSIIRKEYDFLNNINQKGISKSVDVMDRLTRYDDQNLYFNKLELKIQKGVEGKKPFIVFSHIEFLHFPFADSNDFELESFLQLQKNINKKNLKERMPFFLALVPYNDLVKYFPWYFKPMATEDSLNYAFSRFKDPESLKKWKNNSSFFNDMQILKIFYKKRYKKLDYYLEKILKPRESDSFIYFVGCHGEPFLEQDEFLHGNGVDEGAANIPAFIHLPKMKKMLILNEQVGMKPIAHSIKELVGKNLTNDEFIGYAKVSLVEKVILQFDCGGQIFAIRYDGKGKYVQDFRTGTKQYFDLQKDPLMKKDVIDTVSSERVLFFQRNLYDLFLHRLSSNAEELPVPGYCLYQTSINR